MRLCFEGGMSGILRLVKSDFPGYDWPFLTVFDIIYNIIFHLKTIYLALLGVIMFSTTSHV